MEKVREKAMGKEENTINTNNKDNTNNENNANSIINANATDDKGDSGFVPNSATSFGVVEIIKRIPHRYPFLLIDRVTDLKPGVWGKGFKNVTINEHFFQGHFPGFPIMPGVLILEAMAQLGAVILLSDEANKGKIAMFAGMDNLRFRRQVVPGDRLDMEVTITKIKGSIGKGFAKSYVDNKVAVEGEFLFALTKSE